MFSLLELGPFLQKSKIWPPV